MMASTLKNTSGIVTVAVIVLLAMATVIPEPVSAVSKVSKKEYPVFENGLAEVNSFTKQLIKDRGAVKPEEKLWVISDYLSDPAYGYTYDLHNAERDAVKFFKTKHGVCTSFAVLYTLMAKAAGVNVRYMTSVKKNHAVVSFKISGKWRYFDITAQNGWSENKDLTPVKNEHGLYDGRDEYKAAFLNKSGIIYERDLTDNAGYTNEISMYIYYDNPKNIAFMGSNDYIEEVSWDLATIEYLMSDAKPRVKASSKSKAIKLTVRKPAYFATRMIAYEVKCRIHGKKSWSKVKSYKYASKKTVTVKGLKKRKRYDVNVRAVKNIGGVKYRTDWTKATVRTK